jgi:hypothetical protein
VFVGDLSILYLYTVDLQLEPESLVKVCLSISRRLNTTMIYSVKQDLVVVLGDTDRFVVVAVFSSH